MTHLDGLQGGRFKHTDKTDARIRKGYEAGERVLDIAGDLGVTRDVIIGRARRIGLAVTGRQYSENSKAKNSAAIKAQWAAGTYDFHANRKANHSTALPAEPVA